MKYILYARKSTEQEDRQAMSIESQENELLRMANNLGIKIDKTYKESMSAKKIGRPVFNEMLDYISKNKNCIVLSWKVDRLTRNIFDGARIIELLENGNIKEIRTIDKVIEDKPIDKFMLMIDFGVGKKYSDDLSVNVKRGNRAKLEKGGWPGPAPLGYINNKGDKTISADKKMTPFIRRGFDLYATGSYSIKDIANILYEDGFRTRSGKKVHKSKIHTMLSNPFYSGIMLRNGKYYLGSHEQVISKQMFDNAQDVLFGKNHSKKQKHFFPLRGFFRCKSCGCSLTATAKKGYHYYYCTNGKGHCEEHKSYMRSEYLEGIVATAFDDLKFNRELIEIMYEASKEKLKNKENYQEDVQKTILTQLELVNKKQNKLLDNQLADLISDEVYEAKSKELSKQKITLEQQLKNSGNNPDNGLATLERTKEVFLYANTAKKRFLAGDDKKKRKVLEKVLWNLEIQSKEMASIRYKMPFEIIKKSPKNGDFSNLLGMREFSHHSFAVAHSFFALGSAKRSFSRLSAFIAIIFC